MKGVQNPWGEEGEEWKVGEVGGGGGGEFTL